VASMEAVAAAVSMEVAAEGMAVNRCDRKGHGGDGSRLKDATRRIRGLRLGVYYSRSW
jgi:orotate phosphoribosyltransferase